MKFWLSLIMITIPSFAFAKVVNPQSGDRYVCTDSVSGHVWDLRIVDVGDEEAWIRVSQTNGVTLTFRGENAHVEMSKDAMTFNTYMNGQQYDTITFENYDLQTVTYADGGDSRPMSCEDR